MKDCLYEENYKLHSENARLRKNLEQLESSLGIDRLRAHFEAEIKKQLRREEKLKKEADRYYRLWQDAVSELRSKGDIIELLIQLEDLIFRQSSTRDIGTTDDNTINLFLSSSKFQYLTSIF